MVPIRDLIPNIESPPSFEVVVPWMKGGGPNFNASSSSDDSEDSSSMSDSSISGSESRESDTVEKPELLKSKKWKLKEDDKKEESSGCKKEKYLDTGFDSSKIVQNGSRVFLVGCGGSGKSTLAKQFKTVYGLGFSEAETAHFKLLVFKNTIQTMIHILQAMAQLEIPFEFQASPYDSELVMSAAPQLENIENYAEDVLYAVNRLSLDQGVKDCFMRRHEYYLNESAEYWLNDLNRIVSIGYIPTVEDILRTYTKTNGVEETDCRFNNWNYTIVDCGNENGMDYFENASSMIYCVDATCYSQPSEVDSTKTRMNDSLAKFNEICNDNSLKKLPLVLLFSTEDFIEASSVIREKFKEIANVTGKKIYCHTVEPDTTPKVQFVIEKFRNIIF
ncbi:hypothetical protein GCK72_000072 [Caenorhabditis remanei]|uniref:Uncharacterized protein n=1 Tax=Caenorhabditis remanei TaxID=31234 RepID=A0A6A5HJB4_CAERE|nr:hypothetical protein GCK72_000072 [Caenorhabditis remanei]KAF1768260.1 hypothetical protein GCK72_000072 [Caenorhabditis remanei]